MKTRLLIVSLMILLVSSALADSLWNDNSASPYSAQKTYKVGDIINVLILENSSAKNLAKTQTNVSDDLSAKFTHTLQRLAPIIGVNNSVAGNLANKYSGDAATNRGSNVSARIAAWVTEILPNGNLAIRGQHKVEVNNEVQEITITGIVRPKDIVASSTVFSYQVANANLTVNGSGAVSDASAPGWITRLLNWLF